MQVSWICMSSYQCCHLEQSFTHVRVCVCVCRFQFRMLMYASVCVCVCVSDYLGKQKIGGSLCRQPRLYSSLTCDISLTRQRAPSRLSIKDFNQWLVQFTLHPFNLERYCALCMLCNSKPCLLSMARTLAVKNSVKRWTVLNNDYT